MTNSAVVILTDPARCQLADADVLLKALLEVQQLSAAGVQASQAFCDHPAAARQFVEAYAKAYPELQQQSSDLPLPEHLYSLVADGRIGPLPVTNAGEATKPAESAQLYPLYVLSLGAPESLMKALQHSSVAQSNIQVLEIAPSERSRTEAVSVAEAVAAEPAARPSWLAEESSTSKKDDDEALSSEALQTGEPLKLDTVEIDLDHVQVDRNDDKPNAPQGDPALGGPQPAIVQIVPASATGTDTGTLRSGHAIDVVPASDRGVASPEAQPAPTSIAALAPASETNNALPTEPAVVAGPAPDPAGPAPDTPPVSVIDHEQPTNGNATPLPDGSADDGQTSSNPPDDHNPIDESGGMENAPPCSGSPDEAPTTAASALAEDSPVGVPSSSFAKPGEDVSYPPSGSFDWGEDLSYPIPGELMRGRGIFDDLLGAAARADVVDLEALYSDLKASIDASVQVEKFDLSLVPTLQPDGPDAVPRYREMPDPDQDQVPDQILTTVHDTDL